MYITQYESNCQSSFTLHRQDSHYNPGLTVLSCALLTVSVSRRCCAAVQFLGNIALQPHSDLVFISPDPLDVVLHCFQRLLPGHHPSTSIWCFTEEMLHLQDQHGEKGLKKPQRKRFISICMSQTISQNQTFDPILSHQ